MDPITGLYLVEKSGKIQKDGKFIAAGDNMLFHPTTHRVYPISGNVLYDATCGRLSVAVDSAIACAEDHNEQIPYIPYPVDHTGRLVKIQSPGITNLTPFFRRVQTSVQNLTP